MISVIVPVLNEAVRIGTLIRSLQMLDGEKEIIVSDGGSTDGTLGMLKDFDGVSAASSPLGRARQMNAGAEVSSGNILWFVHADSAVSPSSLHDIECAVSGGAMWGFFRLHFYDADDCFMRFIERTSHVRAKDFGLIFGDQGLFVRRDIFDRLGGFADVGLMEDWEFSRRLKRLYGLGNMRALETVIGTSARRYTENGRIRTWLKMNMVKAMYILGVDTERLRRIYDGGE